MIYIALVHVKRRMTVLNSNTNYTKLIAAVAAIGGFLFGYDWVVIGGAKPFYEAFFGIEEIPWLQGWVMSSAIAGCLIGVMVSGMLADKYGRKRMFFLAAVIFTVSAVGTGAVDNIRWFVFYRIFGGIGIGLASNISPMYISEVAPPAVRGRYVTFYQMAIVIGILAAQITNWLIGRSIMPDENILDSWNGQMGWRWMFWAEAVPAVLFFGLIFFIPQSPRWLVSKLNYRKALDVLSKIYNGDLARGELEEIKKSLQSSSSGASFRSLFEGRTGRIILIGIVLAVLQQWCGINVIFNYAQEIFSAAGYEVSDMLFNIVITGIVNVIFTFVGMYTVDKLGRRSLMLFGSSGLTLIYIILGLGYFYEIKGAMMLLLVVMAIACYAMTLAPVTWVILSEIFPNRIRAMAMGLSTFALWSAAFVLTYTFPLLNKWLGASGTFWLYGLICIAGFLFIRVNLSETRGKTLEQIEQEII